MLTVAHESQRRGDSSRRHGAATDPIAPIHGYQIPILPFKRPPTRDDFVKIRRRNKFPEQKKEHPPASPEGERHVDDYA
jgi:hypothetical protein